MQAACLFLYLQRVGLAADEVLRAFDGSHWYRRHRPLAGGVIRGSDLLAAMATCCCCCRHCWLQVGGSVHIHVVTWPLAVGCTLHIRSRIASHALLRIPARGLLLLGGGPRLRRLPCRVVPPLPPQLLLPPGQQRLHFRPRSLKRRNTGAPLASQRQPASRLQRHSGGRICGRPCRGAARQQGPPPRSAGRQLLGGPLPLLD